MGSRIMQGKGNKQKKTENKQTKNDSFKSKHIYNYIKYM